MVSQITDRQLNAVRPGYGMKTPVLCASTANIALTSATTGIDGVTPSSGDRILVWQQTNTWENGVYTYGNSTWERALDFNGNSDVVFGTLVPVSTGTAYGSKLGKVTSTGSGNNGAIRFAGSSTSDAISFNLLNLLGSTALASTSITVDDTGFTVRHSANPDRQFQFSSSAASTAQAAAIMPGSTASFTLSGSTLTETLRGKTLIALISSGGFFSGSTSSGGGIDSAVITNSSVSQSNIVNPTITGADSSGGTFAGPLITGATSSGGFFSAFTASGVLLSGATSTGGVFDAALIKNSTLTNVTIDVSTITSPVITGADLRAALISSATSSGGTFNSPRLNSAEIGGTTAPALGFYEVSTGILSMNAPFASSGSIMIGSTVMTATIANKFLVAGAETNANIGAIRYSTNNAGGQFLGWKSNSTAVGSNGAVIAGQNVLQLGARAADGGGNFQVAGAIAIAIDTGTVSTASMPGRMVAAVTPDGTVATVEGWRLDNQRNFVLGGTSTAVAANSTGGFPYVRFSTAAPSGTPDTGSYPGTVPLHIENSTSFRLWSYMGGLWRWTAFSTST